MGEAYFRGGAVVNKEVNRLYSISQFMLMLFIAGIFFLMIFIPLVPIAYNPAETASILFLPSVLCLASGPILFWSWRLYKKRSEFAVVGEGMIFGGRLVQWSDIEDVKAWSESHREAEVESSPVVGYGMHGYAIGKTLPASIKHRKYRFIVLQVFHRNGMETVYFLKREFWPFVKALSEILGRRGLAPKWLRDLEHVSL